MPKAYHLQLADDHGKFIMHSDRDDYLYEDGTVLESFNSQLCTTRTPYDDRTRYEMRKNYLAEKLKQLESKRTEITSYSQMLAAGTPPFYDSTTPPYLADPTTAKAELTKTKAEIEKVQADWEELQQTDYGQKMKAIEDRKKQREAEDQARHNEHKKQWAGVTK